MGGEKANGSDAPDDDEGSPPHGQGKDDVFRGQILLPGITPAWAGKVHQMIEVINGLGITPA